MVLLDIRRAIADVRFSLGMSTVLWPAIFIAATMWVRMSLSPTTLMSLAWFLWKTNVSIILHGRAQQFFGLPVSVFSIFCSVRNCTLYHLLSSQCFVLCATAHSNLLLVCLVGSTCAVIAQLRACNPSISSSKPFMSDKPRFEPHDHFGARGNVKEDDLCTPERSSRPDSSFSPVPLFSPLPLKYEGGANEVPGTIDTNVYDPNLLNGMSSEEIALLASATDPFAMSPVQNSATTANPNGSNPSATVVNGDRRLSSSMGLVVPQGLTNHLSNRWKNWCIVPSGVVSVPRYLPAICI